MNSLRVTNLRTSSEEFIVVNIRLFGIQKMVQKFPIIDAHTNGSRQVRLASRNATSVGVLRK